MRNLSLGFSCMACVALFAACSDPGERPGRGSDGSGGMGATGGGGDGGQGGFNGGGDGGSGGVAGSAGGSAGSGGAGARTVSLPFAGCDAAPAEGEFAIDASLLSDVDPYCDAWEEMPPLVLDENGEVRLSTEDAQLGFATSGCNVVYAARSGALFLYDLATNRQRRVTGSQGTSDSIVLIGSKLIADGFEFRPDEEGGPLSFLEVQDLATCKRGRIGVRNRNEGGSEYRSLEYSEGRVVWGEFPVDGCQAIGMLDLRTAESTLLTEVAGGVCNSGPDFGGDWVTWSKTEVDGDIILAKNVVTNEVRQVTPSGERHYYPTTDGLFIVVSRGRGASGDLYAYDIETGATFPAVVAPRSQSSASIRNGRLTWTDLRDSSNELYGFTSAHYERILPDGPEVLVRPARSPLIYGHDIGEGLIWLDDRGSLAQVYAMPAR